MGTPSLVPAPLRIGRWWPILLAAGICGAVAPDPIRNMVPPAAPRAAQPETGALFADDFSGGDLALWSPDREGVWAVKRGLLRGDLPNAKQERSFIYAGSEAWSDYAVDLDVCGIRGVDKGVIVRVGGESGVGLDLRGPGYQDVLLHRRQWPLGKARVINANGVWHHVRLEARGHRYRVWINDALLIDRVDGRKGRPQGRIGLAAYTGGVGECTVYFDNVVVTALR